MSCISVFLDKYQVTTAVDVAVTMDRDGGSVEDNGEKSFCDGHQDIYVMACNLFFIFLNCKMEVAKHFTVYYLRVMQL